jgi:RimJ/RimL family protein N-acetyltransferase
MDRRFASVRLQPINPSSMIDLARISWVARPRWDDGHLSSARRHLASAPLTAACEPRRFCPSHRREDPTPHPSSLLDSGVERAVTGAFFSRSSSPRAVAAVAPAVDPGSIERAAHARRTIRPGMTTAPVIETPRLVLRGHRASDLEDSLSLWSEPEVVRYIGGKPFSREEVWARVLRYIGHWTVAGHGFWHVRERATDRFVGEVGFADFKRDLAVAFDGAPESGWVLAPWSHGKGYATEAMTAVLDWGAAAHPRTVCIINHDNLASQRVAARIGYREFARVDYKGTEIYVYERRA